MNDTMPMLTTLEHLRIFVAVAEREHVTKAAEALHVTQSAASGAIAMIEARHDIKLFNRVGRRIELTEAGRVFLTEARAVLARAADAERTLAEFHGLQRGSLRLVASQTIASYWLPPTLARFHTRYPKVEVSVALANTESAADTVLSGAAELGFIEGEMDDPALAHWQVATDAMVLVSRHGEAPPVTLATLREARWIMRERGSGTRSTFEHAMRGMEIDPDLLDIALTLPSNEAVLAAVREGVGCAALSQRVVEAAVAARMVRILPISLPDRPFYAIRQIERYQSRAADAFLETIKPATEPGA